MLLYIYDNNNNNNNNNNNDFSGSIFSRLNGLTLLYVCINLVKTNTMLLKAVIDKINEIVI